MTNLKKKLQNVSIEILSQREQEGLKILQARQKKHIKEAKECAENIEEKCLDYAESGETYAPIYRFGNPPVNNHNRYAHGEVAEEYQPAVGLVIKALKEKGLSWKYVGGSRRNGFQDIFAIWKE